MNLQIENHRGAGIKNWRLVIRNLPFDTKSDDIHELGKKFGVIKNVTLPKCKDPKFPNSCAGFCFVQFSARKEAEKAKEELNFSQFKSRKIAVDWAIDKDTFITKAMEEKQRKEKLDTQRVVFKEEEVDADDVKAEINSDKNSEEESEDDDDSDTDISMKIDDDDEPRKKKRAVKKEFDGKVPRKEDSAVLEGRVIFLRNIDFGTANESIQEEAGKFGEVALAIMCKYPNTDQPSGTAFVHFKGKNAADDFLDKLATEEGVIIDGRQVFGHRALPKRDADALKKDSGKQPKDKRNLHLLRASFIRPGTAQARGMSTQDAEFRERLGAQAKTKLKNLHMFVSPTRLAIHNIPFSVKDDQLRELCISGAKKADVKIEECRIIREKKGNDNKGHAILGKSKGFGFVQFSCHTDALATLRNMNNNAECFTNEKRPIVEFSIENLEALKIKEQRIARAKDPENKVKQSKVWKPAALTVKDSSALVATKRELMTGGKKWLPKKLGEKVRHKNTGGKKSSKVKKAGRNSKTFGASKNLKPKKSIVKKKR